MNDTKPSDNKSKNSQKLRADAARVLFAILEQGKSAREVLPTVQQGYSDQDKAWLQEMVYGVLRKLPLLQYWLRQLLDKPLKNKVKIVEQLILLGLYQLAFSRVSTHAAVAETVSAAYQLKCQGLKGLVNAVLRNFIRQEMAQNIPADPQVQSGLPKWLFNKLKSAYPDQIEQLALQMDKRPPIWLRVSRLNTTREAFNRSLTEQGIDFSLSEQHCDAVILDKGRDITTLPGFTQGWFAVQDGAAQLAAEYLDAQAGERILDCCAAPGGKTCHILERQPELNVCIALDVEQDRMARVEENLVRLGLQAELVVADATDTNSWWDGQQFDRILLDAPCSATGVIRRHPDIKWLRKGADISVLTDLQAVILDKMWPLLKPGGVLLYATCSILPEENQQQILSFIERTPDAQIAPLPSNASIDQVGRQILPGEGQMDGFYYARLLKSTH